MIDALVIGGGIAGVSVAARLASKMSVTLLEAEDNLAYHASGRSAAMFLEDYGNDIVRALNTASAQELHDIGVLSEHHMMMLAKPSEEEAFQSERKGFGMEQLTVGEGKALFPILNESSVAFVGYRKGIYELDTDLLVQHFARSARKSGAEFETGARVTSIKCVDCAWQVSTAKGEYVAKRLVNAAGAWADKVAEMAGVEMIGIQPLRRSMARLPAPRGLDTKDWPFCDGVNEAWYAKPDAGKWLVSPSEEHPMEPFDAYADDMVIAEGLARYEEMVSEPVTRVETTWAGLRSFAPDRSLVLGEDKSAENFFWCAGQGGYGFQTACAASQLLADHVTGTALQLEQNVVNALSPSRF